MFDIIKPNYWELESLGFSDIRTWAVSIEHVGRVELAESLNEAAERAYLRFARSVSVERDAVIDFIAWRLTYNRTIDFKVTIIEAIDDLPWFKISIEAPYNLSKHEIFSILSDCIASLNHYARDYFRIMEITAIN